MKPTCRVNIAPPIAASMAATHEHEGLEVRDVVAGEAHAVFLVAHREQQAAELGAQDATAEHDAPSSRTALTK